MTDCLFIGFNDTNFEDYVTMVRSMGTDSGAYRDLNLAFIEYRNKPYRALDILTHFYFQSKKRADKPFHNKDFLWSSIPYLKTYLSRRGLHFDYVNLFQQEKEKFREKLTTDEILTVVITTTLYVSPHPIEEIVSFVRKYNKTAKIIIGGVYIYNQATSGDLAEIQRQFKYFGADFYVISQEGEMALFNILKALKSGSDFDEIHNIAYKKGDEYITTPIARESNSLEDNMVDYRLFMKEEIGEFVSLRTSKSCPFSCSFCGFPQRAGKYTFLSVDLVEKELDAIREIGSVTTLTFNDDSFNVPKKRFQEILRMMIQNKYNFRWNSFFRSDYGDEETIALMKSAGCEGVFLGIESVDDVMLERMNKTSRKKDYLKVIPLFSKYGIVNYVSFVIGFPGETYETVQNTIDFIEETEPDFFRAQIWYCDPITPIMKKREEYGIKGSAFNWSHNTMDSKTACDMVEKIYLSVDNTIWIPQYGCELWSIFYLQRRGMTLDQVKNFLKCFNAVIKDKLLYPEKRDIDAELLESLKYSCQFDTETMPDMKPVEAISGKSYIAAEKYLTRMFDSEYAVANMHGIPVEEHQESLHQMVSIPCNINEKIWEAIRLKYAGRDIAFILMSAYSILLSRLSGQEDTVLVSTIDIYNGNEVLIPLRLKPAGNLPFHEFCQNVCELFVESLEHGKYAGHIFHASLRMETKGFTVSRFDTAYFYGKQGTREKREICEILNQTSITSNEEMKLILDVQENGNTVAVKFHCAKNGFDHDFVDKLSIYYASILELVGKNPHLLIDEIVLDKERSIQAVENSKVKSDEQEEFHFS